MLVKDLFFYTEKFRLFSTQFNTAKLIELKHLSAISEKEFTVNRVNGVVNYAISISLI